MDILLGFYLPNHFVLLFTICAILSVGFICFYAKRHPNPHFRPDKREVFMISLILFIASGGGSWITARMLDSHIDPAKLGEQIENAQSDAFRESEAGAGSNKNNQESSPSTSVVPDAFPEEVRRLIDPN
ncbi:MAG: hypothetical protein GY899_03240 [Verrucomicrobiaceae bacterium]|nr:hypothetical protein [Verrucomicrobiaceae bacterium]